MFTRKTYDPAKKRMLCVGGGVGEAALIGAALGGVSSAVQGGDPLKGALLGGVTGGAGGAFAGAGAAPAESLISSAPATAGVAESFAVPEAAKIAMTELPNAVTPASIPSLGAPTLPTGTYDFLGNSQRTPFQDTSTAFMSAPPAPPSLPTYTEQAPTSVPQDQTQQAAKPGMWDQATDWMKEHKLATGVMGLGALSMLSPQNKVPGIAPYKSSVDLSKFRPSLPQNAVYQPRYAKGGVVPAKPNYMQDLMKSRGQIDKYLGQISSNPSAVYSAAEGGDFNAMIALNQANNTPNKNYADGGIANLSGSDDYENDGIYNSPLPMAAGGISSLGGYSDGGRMLKGPGNGTSDSIPASIAGKQPARLADGEFVVPARIVSELGNGSSDAGARELYKMMDRVQKARAKTVGKDKIAVDAKARTRLPA